LTPNNLTPGSVRPIEAAMRALLIATVVVPIYTALLHAWIYAHRRAARAHLWLAISALGSAGIAIAVIGRSAATTTEAAISWQRWQMVGGAVLAIGFVRWAHAALRLQRPRLERAVDVFVALDCIAVACGAIFSDEIAMRPALGRDGVVPEAMLTPFGTVVVAIFAALVLYVGVELGRAARQRSEPRPLFAAYCLFAVALLHDVGVGVNLVNGTQLLPLGYLVMISGLSAVLVRHFVRSMGRAEQLATDLHARVEERSAELRRKERQLVHGERLAALGTLAAGVAHEINDPMAFVSSNLNRVEEIWSHPVERRDVPEILDECHDGLARLRATVAELLRLARRSESATVPVDLAEVVASVLPLVRAEGRFRARWTEFLTAVPAVRGDPGLLAQVALQLLLNGIRSIPEGDAGAHRIAVSTGSERGRVRLRVRDSGPPIPSAELPYLFDPFSPLAAEGATSRLGLAVTHQIVKSHGGEIEVSSDQRGTEVTVWLPISRGA
jgi:signal transduction histidine kinase